MGEFDIEVGGLNTDDYDEFMEQIYQELAERGIHHDRLSDWSVKVVVTVYYDIERRKR